VISIISVSSIEIYTPRLSCRIPANLVSSFFDSLQKTSELYNPLSGSHTHRFAASAASTIYAHINKSRLQIEE